MFGFDSFYVKKITSSFIQDIFANYSTDFSDIQRRLASRNLGADLGAVLGADLSDNLGADLCPSSFIADLSPDLQSFGRRKI